MHLSQYLAAPAIVLDIISHTFLWLSRLQLPLIHQLTKLKKNIDEISRNLATLTGMNFVFAQAPPQVLAYLTIINIRIMLLNIDRLLIDEATVFA